MKLSAAITRTLRRAGLPESETTQKDRARQNLSMITAQVLPVVPWWWLDRTTTFATVASTRTYQPVSSNVTAWHSFVDETNDEPLTIVGPDKYDLLDLDRSESGFIEAVLIEGLDATTGYPVIGLWRTPSAVATIRVRYRIDIAEWTSANDDTQLFVLGLPRIMENVILYGAAALLLEEEGDETQSARDWQHHFNALDAAKRQNLLMQGNRTFPPSQPNNDALHINIGTSTVTAA